MKYGDSDSEIFSRDDFVNSIFQSGEHYPQEQMHKCLCALMGETREFDSEGSNFSFLPEVRIFVYIIVVLV